MDFEYDPQKSESNKIKHGIDFEEAQALWDDYDAYEYLTGTGHEDRYLVIGKIDEVLWTAVITYRNKRIRIISVRRSRYRELDDYNNRKGI